MYEFKEGRGTAFASVLGGFMAVGFAAIWIGLCVSMGAPIWFVLFGVLFGVVGLASAGYQLWVATTKNRPDLYDVTTDREEPDPFNRRYGPKSF
jgi:hypothetical protein